jgi:O-antigen/teichoic acid export membrane protein
MLFKNIGEVVRRGLAAIAFRGLGAALALCMHLVLVRFLGASDAGVFYLALAVASIGALVARSGLEYSVLRHVAGAIADSQALLAKSYIRYSGLAVLLSSIAVSTFIFLTAPWASDTVFHEPRLSPIVRWLALSITPLALLALLAQGLKALKRTAFAVWSESASLPFFSIVLFVLFIPFYGLSGSGAAYFAAAIITTATALFMVNASLPGSRPAQRAVHVTREKIVSTLFKSAAPIFWMTLCLALAKELPTLVVGLYGNTKEVAALAVAMRLSLAVNAVVTAVSAIAAPAFSALHQMGDRTNMERVARASASTSACAALPLLAILVFSPGWILGLFGPDFRGAEVMLIVLAVAQLINVLTGPVEFALMMTGHELTVRNVAIASLILMLLLCAVLIPPFGAIGGAVAIGVVQIVQNTLLTFLVKRTLKIMMVPLLPRVGIPS